MTELQKREFVIFDVETTGLSPAWGDRVVEVAALKIKDLKPVDKFYSLVNPQRPISYAASAVNGITQDMVYDAPKAREVFPQLMEFVGASYLVGHNVRFDMGFLLNELALLEFRREGELIAIDTLKIAKQYITGLASYSLLSVARHLNLAQEQRHRAMADVELTFELYKKLLAMAQGKDAHDVQTFTRRFGYCHITN